ncbi:MAG TPA: hypothetical protein VFE33_03750 [Thermoanaerobaculia bacterium]|nr:hypothetical protein [Thermoanaerobaculia bacterium]
MAEKYAGPVALRRVRDPTGPRLPWWLAAGLLLLFVAVLGGRTGFLLLLALLVGVSLTYRVLALRNPVPRVTLTPGRLTPGGSSLLTWSFPSGAERLEDLRIFLEGRELHDVDEGSDFAIESAAFDRIEVLALPHAAVQVGSGSTPIALPRSTRPTLWQPAHRVLWYLCFQGAIRFWPHLDAKFEVDVATPPPIPLHPSLVRATGRPS